MVAAHPVAYGQCRAWLDERLPEHSHLPAASNVAAAADLFDLPTGADAAIAPPGIEQHYGVSVLAEGLADRDYLKRHTDFSANVERHLASRTPQWAAAITGLSVEAIVAFARLYGATRRSYLRIGYANGEAILREGLKRLSVFLREEQAARAA